MKNNRESEQTPCKQCMYYFGKDLIHCAVHPQGKETEYCDDWQKETLKQKLTMNIKSMADNFSAPIFVAIVIGIASTITLGYGLKQNIPIAISAVEKYNQYSQKGSVFLNRAGTAGTTGIARPELVRAVSFLETNRLTQSFEYKDLKANLNYLESQPDNSLMPAVVKDSINKNAVTIESEQTKKLNAALGCLFNLQITGSAITLVIAIGIIKQERNYR